MTRASGHGRDDLPVDDLPVFDAIESLTDPGRPPGGGPPLRGLGPARGAGAAVGILALLVIGIVVGNISMAADPTGSPGPSSASSSSARPSGSPEIAGCRSPRQGEFPAVTLGIPGETRLVEGLFGFGTGYGQPTAEPAWQIPPASTALVVGADSRLVVGTRLRACFRHLIVQYQLTEPMQRDAGLQPFNADIEPSSGTITIDGPPDGDWVGRVTADFDTFGTLPGDVVTVTYFRILSGSGPFVTGPSTQRPTPSPVVSPAVPCGSLPPTLDVGVSLFIGSDLPVAGALGDAAVPAEVHIRPGDGIRMIVDGEACAVSWVIDLLDSESGVGTVIDSISNEADDPAFAAQNRWDLAITGRSGILTADLRFRGGLRVIRTWNLVADPFDVPALFLIGPSGTRFEASAGCGLGLELSNGYQAADSCGSIGYKPGPEALRVQAYRTIHLDLPGWQILSWGASCGRVTTLDAPQFDSPDGCGLGGGSSDSGGPLLDPPAFVLPPGDTVIQVGIGAVDVGGNRFNVNYYAHVIAR
ncbi:MAG: hypothetical protein HYX54_06295 [Chloroflexi bacterium]|nr:hypothetical protein [Chloroflexota bacterium]